MNRYHTSIKICYSLGLQKEFIPEELRREIPNSTRHSWKSINIESYIGAELSKNIDKNLANIRNAHHPANSVPLAAFNAYCKLIVTIVGFFDSSKIRKALRTGKDTLINLLEESKDFLDYEKAANLLSVSVKTLYHWRTQIKFKCDASALLLCVKRHPNQATIPEVQAIKSWLSKPEIAHWGISSIWAQAFKTGATKLGLNSWYHYNALLKFRTATGKAVKPKYNPLRAESVNQIWHADITVFKLNGVKYYIYTVMDNFSRFIHSWKVTKVVSAEIRTETIRSAISSAFGNKKKINLQLVTDGGPENDNQTLKDFIRNSQVDINHTIALRDIIQSNSMQEAFYATAKYRYLYRMKFNSEAEFYNAIDELMHEYNHIKPHFALKTLTPAELQSGMVPVKIDAQIFRKAAQERREFNRKSTCGGC